MSVNFCAVSSGSDGNCTYLGTDNTHILIDAGLSCKKLIPLIESIKVKGNSIDAIFITHEHIDHILGVGVMSRRFDIPVYATQKTWSEINSRSLIGNIDSKNKREVYKQEPIIVNDVVINSFEIPHDSVDAVGYFALAESYKICVATDIGHICDDLVSNLLNSDLILLDCNYDVEMLENGTYTRHLKNRIRGGFGHLSNVLAGELLTKINSNILKHIFLGHLSKENNTPVAALATVTKILEARGIKVGEDVNVHITNRHSVSQFLNLKSNKILL